MGREEQPRELRTELLIRSGSGWDGRRRVEGVKGEEREGTREG